MEESKIIQCPECQAKLALKAGSRLGDRVRCSYCYESLEIDLVGSQFRLVSSAPPVSRNQEGSAPKSSRRHGSRPADGFTELMQAGEHSGYDDPSPQPEGRYWTSFDDLATKPTPVRKPAEEEASEKRKKGLPQWVVLVLIFSGVMLSITLLGGVIYLGVLASQVHKSNLDLAYLPPDAELIVAVRVDTTWNSEFVQNLLKQPRLKRAFDMWNHKPRLGTGDSMEDFRSMTIGASRIGNPRFGGVDLAMSETIIVFRTNKNIDMREARHFGDKKRYNGQTYYLGKHGNIAGFAIFFPDDRTMVMGTQASLFAAIDRGNRTVPRPELDYVDSSRHAMVIYTPRGRDVFDFPDNQLNPNNSEPIQRFTNVVENRLQSVCLSASFLKDVHVQIQGNCSDKESAADLRAGMDQILKEMRDHLQQAKQNLPDQFASVAVQGEKILESATTLLDDETASLTMTIPGNSFSDFRNFQQDLPLLLDRPLRQDAANFPPNQPQEAPQEAPARPENQFRNNPDPPDNNVPVQDARPSGDRNPPPTEQASDQSEPDDTKQVWLVEFNFSQFTEKGTAYSAARQAFSQFTEIPPPSVSVILGRNVVRCIVRGNKPDTRPMIKALKKSGFQVGEVSVR